MGTHRGKRRRHANKHGHEWDRVGDFTLQEPTRICIVCGVVVTLHEGQRWQVVAVDEPEECELRVRLPNCPGPITMEQRKAAMRRFMEAPGFPIFPEEEATA